MAFDIVTNVKLTEDLATKVKDKYKVFKHFTIEDINFDAGCIIDTKKLEICFKHATIKINTSIVENVTSSILVVGQLVVKEPYILAEYYLANMQTEQGVYAMIEELMLAKGSEDRIWLAYVDRYAQKKIDMLKVDNP